MKKEKQKGVIQKIQKLLALAESGNENGNKHEAELAATRARALMDAHNYTLTDIEVRSAEMEERIVNTPYQGHAERVYKSVPAWQKVLLTTLRDFFSVYPILSTEKGRVHLMGTLVEVEVAHYVYLFLVRECEKLTNEYCQRKGTGGRSKRHAYLYGLAKGFYIKLREEQQAQKEQQPTGTDLMVLKKRVLEEFIREKYPRLGQRSNRVHVNDRAYYDGRKQGRELQVRTGVHSRGERDQRRLS